MISTGSIISVISRPSGAGRLTYRQTIRGITYVTGPSLSHHRPEMCPLRGDLSEAFIHWVKIRRLIRTYLILYWLPGMTWLMIMLSLALTLRLILLPPNI